VKDQSWYVAYVPDPKRPIVIAVTVEQGGFGAAAAAPAVRLMLSQWFGLPEKWVVSATPSQDL
jgi:penicillin-binding protein 2